MNQIQPNAKALLPIGVFLLLYLGGGIAFHDFYAMPACVAFLNRPSCGISAKPQGFLR